MRTLVKTTPTVETILIILKIMTHTVHGPRWFGLPCNESHIGTIWQSVTNHNDDCSIIAEYNARDKTLMAWNIAGRDMYYIGLDFPTEIFPVLLEMEESSDFDETDPEVG